MSGWWPPSRWRSSVRGRLREHLLVLAGLIAYVGAVYIAVVVVVGLFLGRSDAPSVLLSVAATAVVAVGFEPVRRKATGVGEPVVGSFAPVPYDVLAGFAPDSGASRMTRRCGSRRFSLQGWVLAKYRCGCWPLVGSDLPRFTPRAMASLQHHRSCPTIRDRHLAGTSVSSGTESDCSASPVVEERQGEQLTPVEEELLDSLAAQAGLVLRNLALTTELHDQLLEVSARAYLLRTSRRKVVASEDVERQLLERDTMTARSSSWWHWRSTFDWCRACCLTTRAKPPSCWRAWTICPAGGGQSAGGSGRSAAAARAGRLTAALRAAAGTSPLPVEFVSSGLGRYPADVGWPCTSAAWKRCRTLPSTPPLTRW